MKTVQISEYYNEPHFPLHTDALFSLKARVPDIDLCNIDTLDWIFGTAYALKRDVEATQGFLRHDNVFFILSSKVEAGYANRFHTIYEMDPASFLKTTCSLSAADNKLIRAG